ncbi:XdhC family protein [Paraliomyxa miuraensis]|uniref:XdhC family protein n=1 Tax=Paraliomyxa miuraensis TaxID=376150 RepID=UPI0022558802|nr:XdhC/CoxI family protein [Paraliomyxa miuraensis]MCX4239836.1 XdhC/CoxI family protein [Paraliomyxa miuraensis]
MHDVPPDGPLPGGGKPLRGGAGALDVAREVVTVLEGGRGRAAMATVVGRKGSAPQILGARLLLHEDGEIVGTVGGGAIEAEVLAACRSTLRDGKPRRIDAQLVRDLAMCCGGSMEVFVESLEPQVRLVILGAGHVAQALAPVAQAAGFSVQVLDDREELLENPAYAGVRTASYDVDELRAALPDLDERDYVVITTRDHARDERALAHLLRRPHRYLGMIGSRRKVHAVLGRILRREHQLGRPWPDLSRVRAPIGLALGGRTPGEIAVSVVAELLAERYGGQGSRMSVVEEAAGRIERELEAQAQARDGSEGDDVTTSPEAE